MESQNQVNTLSTLNHAVSDWILDTLLSQSIEMLKTLKAERAERGGSPA